MGTREGSALQEAIMESDRSSREYKHHVHASAASGSTTTDPVCGMVVDTVISKHRAEHGGQAYHFC